MELELLKYPTGKFTIPQDYDTMIINGWIRNIAGFPDRLSAEVIGLSDKQLGWKYRPDGWNVRQVVHHCADSHMNAFIRFKLALTEDSPVIKPYFENLVAELPDSLESQVEWSLDILSGLHKRWIVLLKNMSEADLARTYIHPEYNKHFELRGVVALYSWHCSHHLAHVRQALEHQGAFNR
ncbi:MAG: putative metal-dependent hydrolase [Bacteroidetes bacterium]|nr:putative metal-dependent hydrolase [Bacteroidota bacterium]